MTMWERRAEPEGFAAVMEGVRNAVPRLKGRAIAGAHDYQQIPELTERSKLRVANFYADSTRGWQKCRSLPAIRSRLRTSPRW